MIQERTIAISEKSAALYQKFITEKAAWWEKHSPTNLVTKFGVAVEVWIVMHTGNAPRIEASFYVNKVLIQTITKHDTIVGTYVFHALGTEYRVHVRTVEEIKAEEARYYKPKGDSFVSKKDIPKEEDNNCERTFYRLVGWDEFDETVQELVEYEDMDFETLKALMDHFSSGVNYIWRYYELTNSTTDQEYRTEINENTKALNERKAEVRAWLQSLPLQ